MSSKTRRQDGPGLFDPPGPRPIPVGTIPSAEYRSAPAARRSGAAADKRPSTGNTPTARKTYDKRTAATNKAIADSGEPPVDSVAGDAPLAAPPPKPARSTTRTTAEAMAGRQREISVSEFFAKNRHLLGFDNKRKALLTTVKEAVDNSLDACEEAGILPELHLRIEQLAEERFRVTVRDNGPGIVKAQIPNIFGKLLYGSKFHRLKMSRGQQGIGISAAGMYGLQTTGKPIHVTSRTGPARPAHHFQIAIDTTKNRPDVIRDEEQSVEWEHGTEVAIELAASYQKGRQSVDEYIEQTAIANPHALILYRSPAGEQREFPRASGATLPAETREIQPHPHGIELGVLMKMLKEAGVEARRHDAAKGGSARTLSGFLQERFCRVSPAGAHDICKSAGLALSLRPAGLEPAQVEKLFVAMQAARLKAPPTDCLAPIGVRDLLGGLLKEVKAEFYSATTRDPAVYRGNPFQIEIALAFGGSLPADEPARVIRFANRVPLLYQQSGCAAFKSVLDVDWRNYGVSQPAGGLPVGPMVLMLHMASVWVPFTSESKEAIADYDEIRKEMGLALRECGRKLGAYVRRRRRQRMEADRRSIFERYIPDVADALAALTGQSESRLSASLQSIARRRTAQADVVLDEEGRPVPQNGDAATQRAEANDELAQDDSVIIVPENEPATAEESLFETQSPGKKNKKRRRGPEPRA